MPIAATTDHGPRATDKHRRFGGGQVKIAALLMVVMGVEAAVIYLLIPPPAVPASRTDSGQNVERENPTSSVATVEVPIDTFSSTNQRAAPGSVIHVTFRLVAIVSRDQELAFDQAANGAHKARVRQAVVKVARSSSLDDLSDPELSTMKRLIREEINKVLRKSYVIEVVVSDFKTLEQ